MAHITQGEVNNYTNTHGIDVYTHVQQILADPYSLSFRVFDISTTANRTEYFSGNKDSVQMYPVTAGQRAAVDVVNEVIDNPPGQKISTGHFYAPWTCDARASVGEHIIEWYYSRTNASAERMFREEFHVFANAATGDCILTEEDIRRYMRDKSPKNILLDDLDYSQDEIEKGMLMVIDKFNITPVLTSYDCTSFPSRYLLLIGTAAHLMEHNAFEQLRNQLNYNDGNIHVGIHDKHTLYVNYSRVLWAEFDKRTRDVKNSINLNGAWGDMSSPYINT